MGDKKATNYALRADMTKAEFVAEVTDGLLPPPAYFPLNVKMNKEGLCAHRRGPRNRNPRPHSCGL